MPEFRRSEEAKTNFRNSMIARIEAIQRNIEGIQAELDDGRNLFARIVINRKLKTRKAQLARYLRRWDRYETEGWI